MLAQDQEVSTVPNEEKEHHLVQIQRSLGKLIDVRNHALESRAITIDDQAEYNVALKEFSDLILEHAHDGLYYSLVPAIDHGDAYEEFYGLDGVQLSHVDNTHQPYLHKLQEILLATISDRIAKPSDTHHIVQLMKLLSQKQRMSKAERDLLTPSLYEAPEVEQPGRLRRLVAKLRGEIIDFKTRDGGMTLVFPEYNDLGSLIETAAMNGFAYLSIRDQEAHDAYGLKRSISERFGYDTSWSVRGEVVVRLSEETKKSEIGDLISTAKTVGSLDAAHFRIPGITNKGHMYSANFHPLGRYMQVHAIYEIPGGQAVCAFNVMNRSGLRDDLVDLDEAIANSTHPAQVVQERFDALYAHVFIKTTEGEIDDYADWKIVEKEETDGSS